MLVFWLSHGDDDLKFLYHSIKERKNSNLIKDIQTNGWTLHNIKDICMAFCELYSSLFLSNGGSTPLYNREPPLSKKVPCNMKSLLAGPISDQEI